MQHAAITAVLLTCWKAYNYRSTLHAKKACSKRVKEFENHLVFDEISGQEHSCLVCWSFKLKIKYVNIGVFWGPEWQTLLSDSGRWTVARFVRHRVYGVCVCVTIIWVGQSVYSAWICGWQWTSSVCLSVRPSVYTPSLTSGLEFFACVWETVSHDCSCIKSQGHRSRVKVE